MTGTAALVFYAALAGLIGHELDPVHKREWRLLFVLRSMPEDAAREAFVLAHVPLLAALLWLLAWPEPSVQRGMMLGLDLFMIVHAGLHARLSSHPAYSFHTLPSRLLIFGTAALAAAHLAMLLLSA